jgi:hypothetical protein
LYSTCLFCNSSLGANEVVESFPVGRRLAFDQRLGRLWVVCRKCAKWNLTPLEERWEAIETCERLFRDTRTRVSTEHVGLAKLSEGLELVRIGQPQRPEFAAWRYGDVFTRRKKRATTVANVTGVLGAGAMIANVSQSVLGLSLGVVGWSLMSVNFASNLYWIVQHRRRNRLILGMGRDTHGKAWTIRGKDAHTLRLVSSKNSDGWAIDALVVLSGRSRRLVLEAAEGRKLLSRVVPHLTHLGGSADDVRNAVSLLEEKGEAETLLRWMATNPTRWRSGTVVSTIGNQPNSLLAVEMALNEENERRALEGELALLEEAWKEAEEIATISDNLALPQGVESRLAALRESRKDESSSQG